MTELKGQPQEDMTENAVPTEQVEGKSERLKGEDIAEILHGLDGLPIPLDLLSNSKIEMKGSTINIYYGSIHNENLISEPETPPPPADLNRGEMTSEEKMLSEAEILLSLYIQGEVDKEALKHKNDSSAVTTAERRNAEKRGYNQFTKNHPLDADLLTESNEKVKKTLEDKAKRKANADQKKADAATPQFSAAAREGGSVALNPSVADAAASFIGDFPEDTSTDDAEMEPFTGDATFSDDVASTRAEGPPPAPIFTDKLPTNLSPEEIRQRGEQIQARAEERAATDLKDFLDGTATDAQAPPEIDTSEDAKADIPEAAPVAESGGSGPEPAPVKKIEEVPPSAPLTREQMEERKKQIEAISEKAARGESLTNEESRILDEANPAKDKTGDKTEEETDKEIREISPEVADALGSGDQEAMNEAANRLPEDKQKELMDVTAQGLARSEAKKKDEDHHEDHEHEHHGMSWTYKLVMLLLLYLSLELTLFAKTASALKK